MTLSRNLIDAMTQNLRIASEDHGVKGLDYCKQALFYAELSNTPDVKRQWLQNAYGSLEEIDGSPGGIAHVGLVRSTLWTFLNFFDNAAIAANFSA